MIRIQVYRTKDDKISGLKMTGHSGTAPHGEDIVCAGVSSLAQTALLGIGEYLHRKVSYKVASGELRMMLEDAPDDLTEAILETALLGVREIAKKAPQAVRISESRR